MQIENVKIIVILVAITSGLAILVFGNFSLQSTNNEKSDNVWITVNIIKNQSFTEENVHNMIWLNASSTLELNAGLGNMQVNFSTNHIDLTKINEKVKVDILLQNITITGNHTLSISATNGIITKSIFFNLIK